MRKLILAAALVVPAIGLAACGKSTSDKDKETVEAMAKSAEASEDNTGDTIAETATHSAESVEAAANKAADDAVRNTDQISAQNTPAPGAD